MMELQQSLWLNEMYGEPKVLTDVYFMTGDILL
jgi:hypothetical protein